MREFKAQREFKGEGVFGLGGLRVREFLAESV